MGGVIINRDGETALEGLFCAGEVCAGIHGANRLAGNALTEVFTMGAITGASAVSKANKLEKRRLDPDEIETERQRLEGLFSETGDDPRSLSDQLKELMWLNAGIVRQKSSLERALESIDTLKRKLPDCAITGLKDLIRYLELENMLCLSEIICRSALLRKESRGSHYRLDYPEEDDQNWLLNIKAELRDGKITIEKAPLGHSRA
jgi:succinate dehydrogenase/fumarate reductase flavoprotein subunit